MYTTKDGEEIFIIDGHVHLWDASPANQRNVHGAEFINCFYGYHTALSPKEELWSREKFEKYGAETMYEDLFVKGYDDMAIFQPTYLKEFYKDGFNTLEQNGSLGQRYPERFIVNGAFDPRDGEAGLDQRLSDPGEIRGLELEIAEALDLHLSNVYARVRTARLAFDAALRRHRARQARAR